MIRITLLLLLLAACAPSQPPAQPESPPPSVDVVELSAVDARDQMAAGKLTSEALTRAYLQRITDVDDGGPLLGAVIEVNKQALDVARARDAER